MPDLPKPTNKNGLKDKREDGMGDSMEELLESSSGRSKFEQSEKYENEDHPWQSITMQFGTLPPVLANNYLLANEFKSKENEEAEKEEDEEEACMLECREGIDQTSRNVCEGEEHGDLLDESSGRSFDYYVLYRTPKRKVRVPRFEKYGSPPRILPPPTSWVNGEEVQEESDREIQKAEDQCEMLHVKLVQEVDSKGDKQEVEIEAAEKVIFRRPTVKLTKHLRPLYVKALVNDIPIAKVLIDNGAAINTIPSRMIKKFTKTKSDMIPTEVILTSFNG
ncbi:Uncharacterized protein Adt_04736 [Abeliophyllum distichum]|uniref:Uncharacterized protein n=1 Tax=Abeliophyllum distichum TaxID=126358 RepID=A0ABD1V251_9LAMI